MIYKDQLNREIELTCVPKRIVSLVPSQTELLIALGLEKTIVGITKFCVHPEDLRKKKAVVGGTKQVHVDKIAKLQPEIILCNKEENTQHMITDLDAIAPVHITDVNSIQDALEMINMYGEIFHVEDKAGNIIKKIEIERVRFQKSFKNRKPLKVAYFIWKKPWMVAASNTFINTMLAEAGFENVFQDEARYPEIELDDPHLKEAELILLSSEPYPFAKKHIDSFQKMFPAKKVKVVDGEFFSWYGSMLQKSYVYFETLHNKLLK